MANIHEVEIDGWMPFNIYENEEALKELGMLNAPSWGLRINYGATHRGPVNENGGHMTFYEFTIRGREAVWYSGVKRLVDNLAAGGCLIHVAALRDMEYTGESDPPWGTVEGYEN